MALKISCGGQIVINRRHKIVQIGIITLYLSAIRLQIAQDTTPFDDQDTKHLAAFIGMSRHQCRQRLLQCSGCDAT